MGSFHVDHDPKFPAINIVFPSGRKGRLTEHCNGEAILKMTGPMAITDATLGAQTVSLGFIPFTDDVAKRIGGAAGETITNTRRMVSVSRDVISSIAALIYQLGIIHDPAKTAQE